MRVRNGLLGVIVAVAGFIAVTVVVTEVASSVIEFSLLVGLPAGGLSGLVLGAIAYQWLGGETPGERRRGAALAAFGVLFLTVLISLVVVANLRNSQALSVAGVIGVLTAIATDLWFRRSDRGVAAIGRS